MRIRHALATAFSIPGLFLLGSFPAHAAGWSFTEVSLASGVDAGHGYVEGLTSEPRKMSAGAACADYDGDGWPDLYTVRGNVAGNLLFRNLGNGMFQEVGAAAGVAVVGAYCGPAFADYDGDGDPDLFVGGIEGTTPVLFRNEGDGSFEDVTTASGISLTQNTYSASFGDFNRDGFLDLLTTHWGMAAGPGGHLWRNEGNGTFADVDTLVGLVGYEDPTTLLDYSFTANFADVNSDGWPDILLTSDFHNTHLYLNDGDGTFTKTITMVFTDENGMGSGVADYDNDGDLDWFVSSIWEPGAARWGTTGNRLYRNLGDGTFEDATDHSGVREGWWGWGSTFGDFNNDGWLDLFHVNGWYNSTFSSDPSRLFVGNGDATLTEMGAPLGVADTGQGRGVVCVDYDRDGDLDIYVANNSQKGLLYRNDGGNASHWLTVKLREDSPNTEGIGARVQVTAAGLTQMRELRAGCNFVSQDPVEAHFGLGAATLVDELRVDWTTGAVTVLQDVAVDQYLLIDQAQTSVPLPRLGAEGPLALLSVRPNPFRAATTIRFRMAGSAPLRLRVYDAAGRLVRDLLDEPRTRGEHEIVWDGRTDFGRPAATGVYVYELEGAGHRLHGKVTRLQ